MTYGRVCDVIMMAGMLSSGAFAADVPPRTEAGQTLVVPEEHLKLGEVYYVTPGEDTQLTCQSDAPLQRVVATCNRIVGYVVAPFDLAENEPPLLAGAFRIPVAALKTGSREYERLLQSPPLLNAAEYPEIAARITGVSEVQLTGQEKGRRSYALRLAGELTVKNQAVEFAAPAQLQFIPFTWQTMGRTVGELLVLRLKLDLKLAELGLQKPGPGYAERVADVLSLDVCLFCNTMSPEKNLDPAIKNDQYRKQLRFLTLVRDFNDPDQGYAFGRAFLRDIWEDAQALNRLAQATLAEDGIETRDLAFVLKAAQRANDLTQFKDPLLLQTLARTQYAQGQLEAARQSARQAAEHLDGAPPDLAAEVRAAVQRYQTEAERDASSGVADPPSTQANPPR